VTEKRDDHHDGPPAGTQSARITTGVLRVLMVEDSESDAELLLRKLHTEYGKVEFERVETGPAMRAALEASSWDVILSDWTLPTFSGPAALELVRGMGLDLPFLIVSGTVGEEVAVAAMRAGAHDYFVKGRLGRLAAAIDRELREGRIRRDAESRYRTLFENAIDAILIADVEHRTIAEANPAAARLFGYEQGSLCGVPVADFYPTESRETDLSLFEALGRGTRAGVERSLRVKKDGTRILVDINAARMTLGGRSMIVGFYRDMTASEQESRALAAREMRYRRLFEAANDGILILDADTGRIVDVNPFLTRADGLLAAMTFSSQVASGTSDRSRTSRPPRCRSPTSRRTSTCATRISR
jgi:two-component system, cell cycle sensor histidine kinase and response regulator CckA